MLRAIAIDLGATSGRIAYGEWRSGKITFQVLEQITHEPVERNGRLEWDFDKILGLCKRALVLAHKHEAKSIGIDSWGVDHGFVDHLGQLMAAPVCYRDRSHLRAFEMLAPHRARLYELTGTQHQPFNTICQLVARRLEDPTLPTRAAQWLILPDLLGHLLGGGWHCEMTQASTTQLLGLDGKWSDEAFEIAEWPVPDIEPKLPGKLGRSVWDEISIAHVGSHDTASAVAGFGALGPDEIFLNVGTWSLAGCLLDMPIATLDAEAAGYTNERAADGRVRFLKNIPGFYFINRLHKDLGISQPVPDWLASAERFDHPVDLLDPVFFNPDSMLGTCRSLCETPPETAEQWAGFALLSLCDAVARTVPELQSLTGRAFRSLRVGGGGSQSKEFCQGLANRSGLPVRAGPAEATVMGNLAAQFLAQRACTTWRDVYAAIDQSIQVTGYEPDKP